MEQLSEHIDFRVDIKCRLKENNEARHAGDEIITKI